MYLTKDEFKGNIISAVEQYIADEENYDDNAQLMIDPSTGNVSVVDSIEISTDETDEKDYFDIMDLVKPDPSAPGSWEPDFDAIESVISEYIM